MSTTTARAAPAVANSETTDVSRIVRERRINYLQP
jgi:hypothetical protein